MSDFVKIAIDAMGGDNSPKKVIDGLIHNHQKNKRYTQNLKHNAKYSFLVQEYYGEEEENQHQLV